jgi:uncharacterized protein YqfB (UPF0267 family)
MTHHVVKSWTYLFDSIVAGNKTADMRDKTEREYKIGDTMTLQRYDQATGEYTGEEIDAMITHVISNDTPCAMSSVALHRNYCILSLKPLGSRVRKA